MMKPHYANIICVRKGEHRYVIQYDDGHEYQAKRAILRWYYQSWCNLTPTDIGRIMEDINGGKTQV